jgi:uncharacterized protein (TIGR03382 family)
MRIAVTLAVLIGSTVEADAFCGFYVDTGGAAMFADATHVVLMREGTRTVLAMQNDYDGPVQDFAVVVPVPAVPRRGDIRTLPRAVFDRVNAMSAPRLVEYWEQDPCGPTEIDDEQFTWQFQGEYWRDELGYYRVKVEAKYQVDEYDVSILSAAESTGLARYLRDNKYRIPDGAEAMLRPYVESGSKWFVAKVDPTKLRFERGRARLSPLRVHYDSDHFALPIRLGLANSPGAQDLVINIIAPQRYEVANRPNAFIPTNLDVADGVRTQFAGFYGALFEQALRTRPGAVITEYSWTAAKCDPCPPNQLTEGDLQLLGGDVLPYRPDRVLTRLHARYDKAGAPDDLVFRAARPVTGGTEGGPREATPASTNAFQARYAIRHAWTGATPCAQPVRGRWGARGPVVAATDPRASSASSGLRDLIVGDAPEVWVAPAPIPVRIEVRPGCGCAGGGDAALPVVLVLFLGGMLRRKCRR